MKKLLQFLYSQQVERIWMLAKIEFRQRYYEHKAGMLWALFKPIADCLIYYFIFKYIMKNNIPNFALYLFLGLIFANIYSECAGGKIAFLSEKRSLYEYSNMNKWEIYTSAILANFIGFFFNLFVFFILFIFIGKEIHFGFSLFLLPILILCCYTICISWSIILSSIYLFARDISQVWQVITTLLFWSSPIVLEQKYFDDKLIIISYLHPFSSTISCARDIILNSRIPDFHHWFSLLFSMTLYLFIALFFIKKVAPFASEKL